MSPREPPACSAARAPRRGSSGGSRASRRPRSLTRLAAERNEIARKTAAGNHQGNGPDRHPRSGCRERTDTARAAPSSGAPASLRRGAARQQARLRSEANGDTREEAPPSSAREGSRALSGRPVHGRGRARAIRVNAPIATHSPGTSLSGRREVNHSSGEARDRAASAAAGVAVILRQSPKSGGAGTRRLHALQTARAAGLRRPHARPLQNRGGDLPSAMNSGNRRVRLVPRNSNRGPEREVPRRCRRASRAAPGGRAGTALRVRRALSVTPTQAGDVARRSGCRGGIRAGHRDVLISRARSSRR